MVGTLSAPAANLIAGIVTVRTLTPVEAGTIGVAALLPTYLVFLHAGTLTGMSRELPIALGAGKTVEADQILGATGRIAWIVGITSAAICFIAGAISFSRTNDPNVIWAYTAAGIAACAQPIILQSDIALRSMQRYKKFGINNIACNLVALASAPFISLFGFAGAIIRGIIISLFGVSIRQFSSESQVSRQLDSKIAWKLARVGFPMLISASLFGLLTVSDRSVVAFVFDREAVGLYAMASIIVTSIQVIPNSISLIMFPKIARAFGESGSQVSLRPFVWKTLIFNIVVLVPIGILGRLLINPLVSRYFPQYIPGIPAAEWACVTSIFWMYLGVGSVFGVLNKMTLYLTMLGGTVALVWVAGIGLAHTKMGLLGPALARLIATASICLFTILYAFYLTSSSRKS